MLDRAIDLRECRPEQDLKAIAQIWYECGWIEDIKKESKYILPFLEDSPDALVAAINGVPECVVVGFPGTLHYLDTPLSLGGIAAVTTSHIARRRSLARKLTAQVLRRQAESGHLVSVLGMFDQGFYDKLGFGTGPYENWVTFDPGTLTITDHYRPPVRLTEDDAADIHSPMINRRKVHGTLSITAAKAFGAELAAHEQPFGLGYRDDDGNLTHFIWGEMRNDGHKLKIQFSAYRNRQDLFELLALMKSLGDQVNAIEILEPGEVQFQDLLKLPFRHERITDGAKNAQRITASAFWQFRILNLEACLAETRLSGPDVEFNLHLSDPISEHLPEEDRWQGVGGEYRVRLGNESSARVGTDPSLPTLTCSINTFSRLWLGVRPASHLVNSTDLVASDELIEYLDRALLLPKPHLGWDF